MLNSLLSAALQGSGLWRSIKEQIDETKAAK